MLISKLLPAFLKNEVKKYGQRSKFLDIGQNIQILVKKQGWYYSDSYNLRQFFLKVDC